MKKIIEKYIDLPVMPNAKGWYSLKCNVCHDYKVRAGFNFTDDNVSYHCFNCNHKAFYFNNSKVNEDFKKVLIAFNIPEDELLKLSFIALTVDKPQYKKIIKNDNPLVEIEFPKSFYKIIPDGSDKLSNIALEYLKSRGIINNYNFYLSKGNTTQDEKLWHNRLIIPYYREDKLIFFQGRTLVNANRRYINATVDNDGVILYGYQNLHALHSEPLIIVEGFFDAYHLNGIAIVGNNLTDKKIKVINESKRRKIYVPDRFGNGKEPALKAIDAGWEVSVPDCGNCKDLNEAIMKYGLLYVKKSLLDNSKKGFAASIMVNATCK